MSTMYGSSTINQVISRLLCNAIVVKTTNLISGKNHSFSFTKRRKTVSKDMGHAGKGDYSIWHYNITHKYASIKHGEITRLCIEVVHHLNKTNMSAKSYR